MFSGFGWQIVVTFGIYTLIMLYVGFHFYQKTSNTEDYFIGGKSIGPIVSALSAGASDMSGWLLMGLPGALYVSGLVDSYIAIGLSVGAFLNWKFVARRLRIYTSTISNSITIPDFFETRFDDNSRVLRVLSALVILIFFTVYTSSGLVGGAKLFEGTFGLNYTYALIIGSAIIVTYTFFGGYLAVCWTDLIQGLLMMGGLIVVPAVMISDLGGLAEAGRILLEIKPNAFDMSIAGAGGIVGLVSTLAWGLGYFGQPHILVRFISIRSVKDINTATYVGIVWMIVSLIGACALGLLGVAYVHKFNLSLADPEKIFILMSQLLFNPWISGILLSAILAAIMSTVSSQLLVSSSTIVEDFYIKILKTKASSNQIMVLSRLAVLLVALVAFVISTDKDSSVLKIVSYAWAGFGASFGSVMLFSLFWRNMTRAGAIAGMATGAIVVIVYKNFLNPFFPIYEIVPGFIAASVAIVLVSLLQKPRSGTLEAYDAMIKELENTK